MSGKGQAKGEGPPENRNFSRQIGVAALILGAGVLLSKMAGFLRDMTIAGLHGATSATDAYFAAFTLPDLLNYMLAGGALSISFIPIFSRYLASGDEEEGWRCFSTTITFMTSAMIMLTAAAMLAAPRVVPFLVPGFSGPEMADAIRMTRIILPAQIFFISGGIVSATLYSRKRFAAPALAPLVYNLCIIAGGVLLSPLVGMEGFAWGVLGGAIIGPFAVPLLAARRTIRFRPSFNFRDRDFHQFIRMAIPLMLGFSLLTVDEWIAKYFASAASGVITHLNNARRLMLVPTGVLAFAAGAAALPYLSQLHAEGRSKELGRTLGEALRGVAQVSVVASGWLAAVALPLVALAFGRGRFSEDDIHATADMLVFFAAGVGAWSIQGVAVRGFYAMRNTLTPMIAGSTVALLSVGVYATSWSLRGPIGLPIATTIGMGMTALATLFLLHRRRVEFQPGHLATTTLKAALLALVSAGAAYGGARLVFTGPPRLDFMGAFLSMALSTAIYGTVVLVLARPLGLDLITRTVRRVLERAGRRFTGRTSGLRP